MTLQILQHWKSLQDSRKSTVHGNYLIWQTRVFVDTHEQAIENEIITNRLIQFACK